MLCPLSSGFLFVHPHCVEPPSISFQRKGSWRVKLWRILISENVTPFAWLIESWLDREYWVWYNFPFEFEDPLSPSFLPPRRTPSMHEFMLWASRIYISIAETLFWYWILWMWPWLPWPFLPVHHLSGCFTSLHLVFWGFRIMCLDIHFIALCWKL